MSELQAGRELDALVAEKVMGWRRIESTNLFLIGPKHIEGGFPAPHYSTDISAAWQIVEKFKMTITPNNCYPHVKAKWCADVELKGSHELWLAGAETAPLAICRAALRAMEQGDRQ